MTQRGHPRPESCWGDRDSSVAEFVLEGCLVGEPVTSRWSALIGFGSRKSVWGGLVSRAQVTRITSGKATDRVPHGGRRSL